MRIYSFYFAILLLLSGELLVAQNRKAPYQPDRLIPAAQLRADFDLMRSALEELHPSLYWYTPIDSMNVAFAQTRATIDRPLTEQAFINRLYPLICRIRCGHTQLEYSVAYQQSPARPKTVHLPFDVFVQDERAWIVTHIPTDTTLKLSMELMSINGEPASAIIETGFNWWNSDGFNTTWKEFFLNDYDFFEDVCWFVYGWKGPYDLSVKNKN